MGSKADREENHQGEERQQDNVTAEASGVPLGNAKQQQQLALERDLERVASDMSESALIGVTVRSNNGDDAIRQLSVRPSQSIRDTIAEAFSCDPASCHFLLL